MRRAGVLAVLALLAACGSGREAAVAQDLGLVLTEPAPLRLPQVGQDLRAGISAGDPARMLVIGDSLAQGFGMLLAERAPARGLPVAVTNRGRPSTGLSRADYYDWPANFEAMVVEMAPDIVVVHMGANDMQSVLAPEGRTGYGTEGWEEAYRVQVRKVLAVAARHDIVLYWIGPGPDGNRNLGVHLARINPWFEEEAGAAGAVYFPLDFTTPPDGSFARNVEVEGQMVAMRTADGSHFTGAGYRLVADRLLDAMVARFPELEPAPVPVTVAASAGTGLMALMLQ